MTGVFLERGHLDTCMGARGGEGQVKTEAEIKVMSLQSREPQGEPGAS